MGVKLLSLVDRKEGVVHREKRDRKLTRKQRKFW